MEQAQQSAHAVANHSNHAEANHSHVVDARGQMFMWFMCQLFDHRNGTEEAPMSGHAPSTMRCSRKVLPVPALPM